MHRATEIKPFLALSALTDGKLKHPTFLQGSEHTTPALNHTFRKSCRKADLLEFLTSFCYGNVGVENVGSLLEISRGSMFSEAMLISNVRC